MIFVMNLKAVKKVSIGDQAYNQMKDQIMSGIWVPGEEIPSENQLMEVLGVSQGTVRQAIQKLSAVGLLETRGREGSYVGQLGLTNYSQSAVSAAFLNEDELKEVLRFRILFECGVAKMVTENATDVQTRKLEKNYKEMLQNLGNLERYVEIDFEFHCLLREYTHNTLVCQIYKTAKDALTMSIREGTEMIGFEHNREDHGLILRVVQNHDSQAARGAMRYHIVGYPALALDAPTETEVDSLVKHI